MKTAVVDDRHRIRIPDLQPGQVMACHDNGNGTVTLTQVKPVEPPPAKCKLVKKKGFTVLVTDRMASEEAIKEALADFPP